MPHRRNHRLKIKSLYLWHRYVGLTTALFVILLASSGIALNHTDGFALEKRYVQNRWLLDWYGIQAPDSALFATTTYGRLTLLGTKLYLNAQPLDGEFQMFYGAVAKDELLVAAVDHDLLLLSKQGEIIERLTKGAGVPDDIEGLGTDTQGQLIITTKTGHYRADDQLLNWQTSIGASEAVAWKTPQSISDTALAHLQADYLGRILRWERVLLDLHSGRLFGTPGPWLMDVAAILMLFLACSGIFIWLKRKR